MKEKVLEILGDMLLNSERVKIFSNILLSRQELGPEICVPLHFINTTASKLMEQNGEAETLFMKNF